MALYVCSGAKLKCSMGSQEAGFDVVPAGRCLVRIEGNLVGTIMDYKPFVNIKPFGQCKSLANPTVAAATAANYGKLQPMPCVPNTVTPWIGGKMDVQISEEPTLLDNSKLMCMWMGMIEITNPGQDFVMEGAESLHSPKDSVKSEKKAKDVVIAVGESAEEEEDEEIKELTVKDFVEILKKIEDKQGYEAARHYAMNEIDYWKINELAMKYVKETDYEKKEEEKDNDPNLMPSRYMLLYGADDDELRKQGNINKHPDNFENKLEHEISVEMLRKGLKICGYDVENIGPFDDVVYHAFLQYHWQHGRVSLENIYEDDDDHEIPLDRIANKYGIFTWKYFHDKYNGEVNHVCIMEELSCEYGDELLTKKGADPQMYKPGVSYHYPWGPFRLTVISDDEKGNEKDTEELRYEIYDRKRDALVAEGTVVDGKIEDLLPYLKAPLIYVNGVQIILSSVQPEQKISEEPLITEIYWSYGENYIPLPRRYPFYVDLNLHVKTENYQDGSKVKITIRREDGKSLYDTYVGEGPKELEVEEIVSQNEAIFKNVLGKYTLRLNKDSMPVIIAEDKLFGVNATVSPTRPRWDDVYEKYPSLNKGTAEEVDERSDIVFERVLDDGYGNRNPGVFINACATRVSVALVECGMKMKQEFLIQKGTYKGEGFTVNARSLCNWLSRPNVWDYADEIICGKMTFEDVVKRINGRNGIYIILDSSAKKNHATLWIGANNNVIGKKHYIENGCTVYFWELKDLKNDVAKK